MTRRWPAQLPHEAGPVHDDMTWTRIDDTLTDTGAYLSLGRSARALHIEGMVFCNRLLNDGHLLRTQLRRATDHPDPMPDVAELVASGLWVETEEGWQLDWTHQETAADIRRRQGIRNERQARYNRRQQKHASGDHSECTDTCPGRRRAVASHDGSPNASHDALPSLPIPSRPVPSLPPQGEGNGNGERADAAASPAGGKANGRCPHGHRIALATCPEAECIEAAERGGE